jgi:hypothetical protein
LLLIFYGFYASNVLCHLGLSFYSACKVAAQKDGQRVTDVF